MPFADPSTCPSCGGRLDQAKRCSHCGLDLTTHEIQQVWQALSVADRWLDVARQKQGTSTAQPAATAGTPAAATLPAHPPAAEQVPPAPRKVSTGAVLLTIGAVCILVAGSIFITVSWGSLGVAGRAAVLLLVTILIGVLGRFVTRRKLRGSAEAVWSVFLGLVTLDWFAARDQGLLGLDVWAFAAAASVWAALVIGFGLGITRQGQKLLSKQLVAPSIVGGAGAWIAGGSLAAELADHVHGDFWPGVLATAVAALATGVMHRGGMRIGAWIGGTAAGLYALFGIGAALAEAVDHPSIGRLTGDAHGLPLLLVVLAAVGIGVALPRGRWIASAVAVAGAATLVILPVEDGWHDRGGYVSGAVLVALGAWALAQRSGWARGARLTISIGWLGLVLASAPWGGRLLAVAAEGATGPRTDELGTSLRPSDLPDAAPWSVVLLVGAALAAVLVAARRWPEPARVRPHLVPTAWTVAVLWGLSASVTSIPPAVSVGSSVLVAGVILAVVLGQQHIAWTWVGPALIAVAPLTTLSSWPASAIVWPLAGLALVAVAIRAASALLRAAAAFVATGWSLGTTAVVLALADTDDQWIGCGLVVAMLVGLAVGVLVVRDVWAHRAVEGSSALLGAIGLTIGAAEASAAFNAFLWTVAGAGVVVLGLASPRRRWYGWVGSGLLGVAYVLRLAASDVETVEAYTVPFAVFLLAAGWWFMRDPDGPGSVRALLPGVLLALLPSLPQALDDPTGLRALLLGLGSAIAVGAGIARRWKAPFVVGAIVLTVLVLANLGPVAAAVPRWTLIAAAGVLFGGAGITWEERVRDGRTAAHYVASMR